MFLRIVVAHVILGVFCSGALISQVILLADDFEDGSSLGWQTFNGGWSEADGVYHDTNTAANTPVASVWQAGYSWQDYHR